MGLGKEVVNFNAELRRVCQDPVQRIRPSVEEVAKECLIALVRDGPRRRAVVCEQVVEAGVVEPGVLPEVSSVDCKPGGRGASRS